MSRLYDCPISNQSENSDDTNSQLSASELRKMRNKQRKAMLKATAESDKAQKKSNDKRDGETKNETAEYIDPVKLEKTNDPMNDALRFLNSSKIFGRHLVEVHILAFEVYLRKGKLLLQLQSLKRAYKVCPPNSRHRTSLLRQSCIFLDFLHSKKEQLNQALCSVLEHELSSLPVFGMKPVQGEPSATVDLFAKLPTVEQFVERHLPESSKSLLVRLARIEVKHQLSFGGGDDSPVANDTKRQSPAKPACCSGETHSMLSKLIEQIDSMADLTLDDCHLLFDAVKGDSLGQVSADLVEKLRQKLHSFYPYASRFMSPVEFDQIDKELLETDFFTGEPEEYNCSVVEDN